MEENKLYSPNTIKKIMTKYDFKFSKRLGQNFIIDGNIIDRICSVSEISPEDGIIEIGPGIGTLTYELCKRAKKVIAIEIDSKLMPVLEENLHEFDNLKLIREDILKIDMEKLIEEEFKDMPVKVVANLPYYITTPIIMKLLEERLDKIESIIVMVQKEVANRFVSKPNTKEYGSITAVVNYYAESKIVLDVPKTVFMPRPKVDSAVLRLDVYDKPKVKVKDEKFMFKIIKLAFQMRRKTILNALSSADLEISKDEIKNIFIKNGIDFQRRGETFSLEEFAKIADILLING